MSKIKPTILYVDDEEINLRLFKNTFRRNYNVVTVSSGKEGLELLASQKFDLIVTDQRMPNMTGVELLSRIQEMFPGVPPARLILSGYGEPEAIEIAFKEYGLFKYISKPWEEETLIRTFNEALT
jgi:CheY-like chemotaxis protein